MEAIDLPPTPSAEESVRSEAYALIAALLREPPTTELLNLLSGIHIDTCRTSLEHAYSTLQQSAARTSEHSAKQEHQELFIGVGRGELLPFGSWYQTGFMMEKPLMTLRLDLQELGFKRQADTHEPEDHVAALCEVMGYLIHESSHEQQQRFFRTHIQEWIQRFFNDLQNAKCASFYIAAGQLGSAFMQEEIEKFNQPQ